MIAFSLSSTTNGANGARTAHGARLRPAALGLTSARVSEEEVNGGIGFARRNSKKTVARPPAPKRKAHVENQGPAIGLSSYDYRCESMYGYGYRST
ncbi:hypothetical protein THAOC_04189, partial [Thalassiosira oceanica]